MNLRVNSKQFLFLYNTLRRVEKEYMDPEEEENFNSVKYLLEDVILNALEDNEFDTFSTGYDKWVKSETNKIQGLEEELNNIKNSMSNDQLVDMFKPIKKETAPKMRGRKKKTK